jgi:hypothetical protein
MKASSIDNRSIKINFNGKIKRAQLPESFEKLTQLVISSFELNRDSWNYLSFSYVDDEGDRILLSNEFDYNQALYFVDKENISCFKVNVEGAENFIGKEKELNEMTRNNSTQADYKLDFTLIKKPATEDDIMVVDMNNYLNENTNEMKLSTTELAKSVAIGKENFANESNEEEYKQLVDNIEDKDNEEKSQEKKEKSPERKCTYNFRRDYGT